MAWIDAVLAALGLKKVAVLAGLCGGGISGGMMPGPLAALGALWKRILCGAICGALLAGYGAVPLAEELGRPNYLPGIALGLGLFGLSFIFKVLKTWNEFDLSKFVDNLAGRFTK